MSLLFVVFGGAFGALARYGVVYVLSLNSYMAVIAVNFVGSFIIGYLYPMNQTQLWLFLAIGFCGAFTTFSTFSLDAVRLIQQGALFNSLIYIILCNALCLIGCYLGFTLYRLLN